MVNLVKADEKGRVLIRGSERGRQYLVSSQDGGWWVTPAPKIRAPKARRKWAGPRRDLSEHLAELARLGFAFEPSEISKQKIGPCRF